MPTVATMVVPNPRVSLRIDSLTSVIPAPSSPASPTPAMNRMSAYIWIASSPPPVSSASRSGTPLARFASE